MTPFKPDYFHKVSFHLLYVGIASASKQNLTQSDLCFIFWSISLQQTQKLSTGSNYDLYCWKPVRHWPNSFPKQGKKWKSSKNCSCITEHSFGYWISMRGLVQHLGCILYLTEKGYKPSPGNSSNPVPRDEHIVWHWRKEKMARLLDNGQLTFSTAVRTWWENVLNLL